MTPGGAELTDEEQQAFRQSVANVQGAAERHLAAHPGADAAIGFVASLHGSIDSLAQSSRQRGVKLACTSGCSYCCHARVEALPVEIFRIARFVRQAPAEHFAVLIARLEQHSVNPDPTQTWAQRAPCAFLDNGLCSIYAIRPSACRRAHSLDVEQCRAGAAEIPQGLELLLGVEAMIVGTAQAYQVRGLMVESHELCGALLQVLADSTVEERWYKGEQVFER
jgi:hypothetical protein